MMSFKSNQRKYFGNDLNLYIYYLHITSHGEITICDFREKVVSVPYLFV